MRLARCTSAGTTTAGCAAAVVPDPPGATVSARWAYQPAPAPSTTQPATRSHVRVALAPLVSCPLIGRLRGEWTSTEPEEGRRGGAGGAVLGNEFGALDRCSMSERYPEAGSAVSSHAQAWTQAPAPRLPTSSVARRLYALRRHRHRIRNSRPGHGRGEPHGGVESHLVHRR